MNNRNPWAATTAIALILAVLQAWQPAEAAATGGSSFGADDPQVIPCELFTTMHEKAPTGTERQFYNWAQGYFAGRNAAAGATPARDLPASGAERSAAFGKLLGFCAANPSASFGAAVQALWSSSS
jgi:hypothetical protein